MIRSQQEQINFLASIITVLTILLTIFTVVIPVVTYLLAIMPSKKMLAEFHSVMDEKVKSYLDSVKEIQVQEAIRIVTDQSIGDQSAALVLLKNESLGGINNKHLFELGTYLVDSFEKSNLNVEKSIAIIQVLRARKNDYSNYFLTLVCQRIVVDERVKIPSFEYFATYHPDRICDIFEHILYKIDDTFQQFSSNTRFIYDNINIPLEVKKKIFTEMSNHKKIVDRLFHHEHIKHYRQQYIDVLRRVEIDEEIIHKSYLYQKFQALDELS